MDRIKVLIVDDSALVREVLRRIFQKNNRIEIIGTAENPKKAIEIIKKVKPDVITLDIEMPVMDGLTFLRKLMGVYPIPVIVISSLTVKGSETTLKALEYGAVDFVAKPKAGIEGGLEALEKEIVEKVIFASKVETRKLLSEQKKSIINEKKPKKILSLVKKAGERRLITIGASTGGTVAIRNILTNLPEDMPPILIIIHMPQGFTATYAENLNKSCKINVKETEDNEELKEGWAYIAQGGKHTTVIEKGKSLVLKVKSGQAFNGHLPSIDKTFYSISEISKLKTIAVVLTGMGKDGSAAIPNLYNAGAYTIAQDEKTSLIFGMPKKAIETGKINEVASLDNIANKIIKKINE